jgi:hypothetical protein
MSQRIYSTYLSQFLLVPLAMAVKTRDIAPRFN